MTRVTGASLSEDPSLGRWLNVRMGTIDPDAVAVLSLLRDGQRRVLGADLVGSYLFGSAATGTFEPGSSDVDTIAVLRSDPTDTHLGSLRELHAGIVREMPDWDDRVEAVYLSTHALMNFRTTSPAARISPGEPFHPIEVDGRWLIDWYQLRTVGIALYGPPATQVAPPIMEGEYVEAVRQHLLAPSGSTRPSLPGIARTPSSPCAEAFERSEPASTSPSEKGRGGRLRSCPSTERLSRMRWRGESGAKTPQSIPARQQGKIPVGSL